jgi:2-(1,2-epoxy-1,2-dihydrophenyl)acetyl-CoA isomerase
MRLDEKFDYVDVSLDEGVAHVTLDRPDAHNALDVDTATDLKDALAAAAGASDVRCLVLSGTGGAFCSGADLAAFEGDETDGRRLDAVATRLHAAVRTLAAAAVPTVTAVNGVAAGGGFGLALAGDLVLAKDGARFEYSYPRIGLSGDAGATWFLPRLVGLRRAREFLLLDEPVDAKEAVEMRLATEAVPAESWDERVSEVADDLANGPTKAYATTKTLLDRSYERTLDTQLTAEKDAIADLARTADYAAGYQAFFTDAEPEFSGER